MPDGEGILLEVDGVPAQAHHLAAAQTVEGRQLHRHLDERAAHGGKQRCKLAFGVEARLVAALARPVHLVRRIHRDQVGLDGVPERPVDERVVMDHGVGLHALPLLDVERLDVNSGQPLERDALLAEPRVDGVAQKPAVRAIGGHSDGGPGDLQPALQIIREQLIPGRIDGRVRRRNHEMLSLLHQERLSTLLVALDRQAGGNPLGFAPAVGIPVAQHRVVVALFLLKMSCNHDRSSFSRRSIRPSRTDAPAFCYAQTIVVQDALSTSSTCR